MSRVGKYPVTIPSGVTVSESGGMLTVKGKLGELKYQPLDVVETTIDDGKIVVAPRGKTKRARMMWGTTRALLDNMVKGVSEGFTKRLEIQGVGYKAQMQGKTLVLSLGFSHDVNYPAPEGIDIKTPSPTLIEVSGTDAQKVGQVAAEIRSYRPPEPYKGKGVRYQGEFILRKEGKKK